MTTQTQIKSHHRYSIRIAPGMPDRTRCPHCGRKMVIEDGAFMLCEHDECPFLLHPAMNALIDRLCRMNSEGRLGNEDFEQIFEEASEVLVEEAQTTWDCLAEQGRAELEAGR